MNFTSHDHIELLVNGAGEMLFFRSRDGPWIPTLRIYHKFPVFLPMLQVDKGAIRFVLSGANIMCPGLTSPGAYMNPVDKGAGKLLILSFHLVNHLAELRLFTVVAIMAEGKEHCLAIGVTTMSSDDM